MELRFRTYREVASYLRHSAGIIVPLGSIEQHGPSGLMATDSLCAWRIARAAGLRTDALVAPTLELGQAQFNLEFPGTISLRAATQSAVIRDVIDSLARQGFEAFYFLNAHGGNLAPLQCAIQDWQRNANTENPVRFRFRNWWQYASVDALRKSLYGRAEGMHGTPSEIAIVQHLYPETIREEIPAAADPLSDEFLSSHAGDNHAGPTEHKKCFPDGLVGSDPGLARPEHGAKLFEAAVTAAAADYQCFLSGDGCQ